MGEIVLRAPWLTNGYLKDEEKNNELRTEDWLHTGDLAVMLKDVIKSVENVFPRLLLRI